MNVFDNYKTKRTMPDGSQRVFTMNITTDDTDYDRLRPLNYVNADVVLVVFSLTQRASFEAVINRWIPEVKHFMSFSSAKKLKVCE